MQRRRKIMPGLKRIRAVYSFPGQTENVSVHHKNAPLKIFDARVEVRNPVPVPVYLAPLDEPRNRERTVTEDVSSRVAEREFPMAAGSSVAFLTLGLLPLEQATTLWLEALKPYSMG